MHCLAPNLTTKPCLAADWHTPPWRDLPVEQLRHHMGARPEHFPLTEVKIGYDHEAMLVKFRVADRYVRAVARHHQEEVYRDSCVEFFFTPSPDPDRGYFNLEMNCGGTMLFHFQTRPREERIVISPDDCARINISHSLPALVEPEIMEPVTWAVAYRLPFDLLGKYCPLVRPAPGATWRVNFTKCADHSSHPHWLTWAPLPSPIPNFHLPHSFGVLEFL